MAEASKENQGHKSGKTKIEVGSSDEEAKEAIKAEKKIKYLKEKLDTGQHPTSKEKYSPLDEEDWRGYE